MDKQKIEAYQLFSKCENLLAFSTTRSTFSNEVLPRFTGEPEDKVKQNRVYLAAVLKMQKKYHSNSENILAAIGPSIGPEVYEVGSEVVEEVRKNLPLPDKILQKNKSGKFHFNLWEANRQILLAAGLKEGNIRVSEECTFQKENKYYSARREGIETGRIVSGIMLV